MDGGLSEVIVDAVRAGPGAALMAVRVEDLAAFFHAGLQLDESVTQIGTGLPASPGAASGRIVLTAQAAMEAGARDEDVILVRRETTPDDVLGMQAAAGILTARGGLASHAAIVARGWGTPAVVGAADLHIAHDSITIGGTHMLAGDPITIDGTTGAIYAGAMSITAANLPDELDTLLRWADDVARDVVTVRANADTVADAARARGFGARGIGLCRTEHMFLVPDRLPAMRRFILSDDAETEADALAQLESAQASDFEEILDAMDGLPVTVRLLDPPLHEFLPDLDELIARDATGDLDGAGRADLAAVRRLHESNPMLGTRGVRLGILRRGLYEMQVRALCTAATTLLERGRHPRVEIMVPLVVDAAEMQLMRGWIVDVLDDVGRPELADGAITIGAMIETPRAALTAAALAEHADFFSFGTNDLTQLTYAFSRDDVEARLVPAYLANGILTVNPFARLDVDGVGELIRLACDRARSTDPSIRLGACGEHAGDPASIEFLVASGLDSISCSPYRVPLARLAVAQALLACGRVNVVDVTFSPAPPEPGLAGDTPTSADGDDTSNTSNASESGDRLDITVDPRLVLHVLKVRGFVTSDGFRASIGEHPASILDDLVTDGTVRYMEARDLYGLLPAGKERHEELLDSYATDPIRDGLRVPYGDFLVLNDEFKQLCTDWQVRAGAPNDHTDTAYDQLCIDGLAAIAARATPIIGSMTATVPRLARYDARLGAAARCVADGDSKRFTGVMCESFHDVWMELHEDLIVLQRIDRAAEGSF